jgi:nucleoid DNA-binding protein
MKLKKKKRAQTIGRARIAEHIANNFQLSNAKSVLILEVILFLMIKHIKKNKHISIVNFGRFILHSKKEHKGINPQTKEKIIIPEKDCILFHASRHLKHFLNDSKVELKKTNFSNEISRDLHEHLKNLQMKMSIKNCTLAVNILFQTIATELKKNKRIELRNFGIFGTRRHKPRKACNPQNGQVIFIRSKNAPFFKYSKHMFS